MCVRFWRCLSGSGTPPSLWKSCGNLAVGLFCVILVKIQLDWEQIAVVLVDL